MVTGAHETANRGLDLFLKNFYLRETFYLGESSCLSEYMAEKC